MRNICNTSILLFAFFVLIHANVYAVEERDEKSVSGIDPAVMKEFQAIDDSICAEAKELYLQEYAAWHSSDEIMPNSNVRNSVAGMAMVKSGDGRIHYLYSDNKGNCLFEWIYNPETKVTSRVFKSRPLTEEETENIKSRASCINASLDQLKDKIFIAPKANASLNFDLFVKKDGNYRLYILQGTTNKNVIPLGNDYVVDLDRNYKVIAFKRLHKKYFEIPVFMENGEKIVNVMLSHTLDNPHMTPTDIVNFMLYGHDYYGLNEVMVVFTYKGVKYLSKFDATTFRIKTMLYSELDVDK